jgi:pimeloyl-ACP methyl ester carboxylesterase
MTADVELIRVHRPAAARRRILLLHGLGNSASVWQATRPLWDDSAEVWSAQLPWRSDGPADWSHAPDVAGHVGAALDAVPGGADTVVAHSFAANLTLELLSRELAAGVDVTARYGLRAAVFVSPFYRRRPADFHWQAIGEQLALFRHTIEVGVRRHSARALPEDLRADIVRHICDRVGAYGWARFFEVYLRTPWLRTELVALPCLVVAGRDDETAPPAEAQLLAADLPYGSGELLTGCGHFPMIEQPARLVGLIRAFLDAVPADRRLIPEEWYR